MAVSSPQLNSKMERESDNIISSIEADGGGGISAGVTVDISKGAIANDRVFLCRGLKKARKDKACTAKERISRMPPRAAGKRSSIYRGVTRHRWTGRYEAHLWDKSTWNQNQNKKGKQVYLGAYDEEEAAARAYDLAALKYWGPGALINFPVTDYARDIKEMKNLSREDYLTSLRRKGSGISKGVSKLSWISSQWEPSPVHLTWDDYIIHLNCVDNAPVEYGDLPLERKIDLTNYIKWWNVNRSSQADSSAKLSERKHSSLDNIGEELKSLVRTVGPTEPYQLPRLGACSQGSKFEGTASSALSILSRSRAYKCLQEKVRAEKEKQCVSNDVTDKTSMKSSDGVEEKVEVSCGIGSGLLRDGPPMDPFISARCLSEYKSIDGLEDPASWPTFAPLSPIRILDLSPGPKTEMVSRTL